MPGLDELKAAGLLEANLPPDFEVPTPSADGGDGDGEFEDDEPNTEEYGEALDEHLAQADSDDSAED